MRNRGAGLGFFFSNVLTLSVIEKPAAAQPCTAIPMSPASHFGSGGGCREVLVSTGAAAHTVVVSVAGYMVLSLFPPFSSSDV